MKLEPCPFCGGEGSREGGDGNFWVECVKCGSLSNDLGSRESADELWNTRPASGGLEGAVRATKLLISDCTEEAQNAYADKAHSDALHYEAQITVLNRLLMRLRALPDSGGGAFVAGLEWAAVIAENGTEGGFLSDAEVERSKTIASNIRSDARIRRLTGALPDSGEVGRLRYLLDIQTTWVEASLSAFQWDEQQKEAATDTCKEARQTLATTPEDKP